MQATSDHHALRALRDVLADLYGSPSDARRIADDVGLRRRAIDFSGSAESFWHAVLGEALASGQVEDVVGRAIDEYPGHQGLQAAVASYRVDVQSAGAAARPAKESTRHARDLAALARSVGIAPDAQAALARYIDRHAAGAYVENVFLDAPVPLSNVFVELMLSRVDPEYDRDLQTILARERFAADARRRRFELRAQRRLSIHEVMTAGHRTQTILGDPGSGKTTLLLHLRHQVCRGAFGRRAVAFIVPLKHYALTRRAGDISLLAYVARHQLGLTDERTATGDWIERLASTGLVYLLLDGLDEIANDEATLLAVRAETNAVADGVEMLLTSRRAGYPRGLLSPSRTCEIIELSDEAIRDLIRNWHRWIDNLPPEETSAFLARVFDSDVLRSMAGNPCLLSLLCYLNRNGVLDEALSGRTELYRRAVEILRRDRPGQGDLLDASDLGRLGAFSYWLFERGELPRQLFTTSDYEQFGETTGGDTRALGDRWLRTRLLSQWNAESTYLFTHLTFQEWFAARHLDSLPYPVLAEVIERRAFHPYWREVWRFFAGFCRNHPDGNRRFALLAGALLGEPDVHGLVMLTVAAWAGEFGAQRAEQVLRRPLRDQVFRLARSIGARGAVPADDVDDSDTTTMLRDAVARAAAALDALDAAERAVAVVMDSGRHTDLTVPTTWPSGIAPRLSPFPPLDDALAAEGEEFSLLADDVTFAIMTLAHIHTAPVQAFLLDLVAGGLADNAWDHQLFTAIAQCAPAAASELFLAALEHAPSTAIPLASSMTRSPVIGEVLERALPRRMPPIPEAVAEVAIALAVHGHPRSIALAAQLVDGEAPAGARHHAVIALGLLDVNESTAALLRALDRVRNRETLIIVLEHLRQRKAAGGERRLKRLVAARDPSVRWAALALLARRRSPADLQLLRRQLLRPEPELAAPAIEIVRRERVRACDDLLEQIASDRGCTARVRRAARFAVAWRGLEPDVPPAQRSRALATLVRSWNSLGADLQEEALRNLQSFPPNIRRQALAVLRPYYAERLDTPMSAALARLIANSGDHTDRTWLLDRMARTDLRGRALVAVALAGIAPECLLDRKEPEVRMRLVIRAVEEGVLFHRDFMRTRDGVAIPYLTMAPPGKQ